jgi:acyl carrier protein
MTVDRDQIDATSLAVRRLIGELAPEPCPPPDTSARLKEDLGYHSLALAELAVALMDEYGVEVDNVDEALDLDTVGDVERYLAGLLAAKLGA